MNEKKPFDFEGALARIDQVLREDQLDFQRKVNERSDLSEFQKGLRGGVEGLKSGVVGSVGAVQSALGFKDAAFDTGRKASAMIEEASTYQRDVPTLGEVENVGDFGKWVAGTMGQLTPSMVDMAVSGIIGGAVGSQVVPGIGPDDVVAVPTGAAVGVTSAIKRQFGKRVLRELIEETAEAGMKKGFVKAGITKGMAESAAKKKAATYVTANLKSMAPQLQSTAKRIGARWGSGAAVIGSSAPLEGGGMWTEGLQAGYDKPYSAIGLGLLSGASEIFLGNMPLAMRSFLGGTNGSTIRKGMATLFRRGDVKTSARFLWDIAENMGEEAVQEGFQEFLSSLNAEINDPNFKITSKETFAQWAESAAAGALGGLVFAAPVSVKNVVSRKLNGEGMPGSTGGEQGEGPVDLTKNPDGSGPSFTPSDYPAPEAFTPGDFAMIDEEIEFVRETDPEKAKELEELQAQAFEAYNANQQAAMEEEQFQPLGDEESASLDQQLSPPPEIDTDASAIDEYEGEILRERRKVREESELEQIQNRRIQKALDELDGAVTDDILEKFNANNRQTLDELSAANKAGQAGKVIELTNILKKKARNMKRRERKKAAAQKESLIQNPPNAPAMEEQASQPAPEAPASAPVASEQDGRPLPQIDQTDLRPYTPKEHQAKIDEAQAAVDAVNQKIKEAAKNPNLTSAERTALMEEKRAADDILSEVLQESMGPRARVVLKDKNATKNEREKAASDLIGWHERRIKKLMRAEMGAVDDPNVSEAQEIRAEIETIKARIEAAEEILESGTSMTGNYSQEYLNKLKQRLARSEDDLAKLSNQTEDLTPPPAQETQPNEQTEAKPAPAVSDAGAAKAAGGADNLVQAWFSGQKIYVKQSDLDGKRNMLPLYTAKGERRDMKSILRENIETEKPPPYVVKDSSGNIIGERMILRTAEKLGFDSKKPFYIEQEGIEPFTYGASPKSETVENPLSAASIDKAASKAENLAWWTAEGNKRLAVLKESSAQVKRNDSKTAWVYSIGDGNFVPSPFKTKVKSEHHAEKERADAIKYLESGAWAKSNSDADWRGYEAERGQGVDAQAEPVEAPQKTSTSIGKNQDGNDVFVDKNGVRSHSTLEGLRVSQPVAIVPGRAGVGMDRDNAEELYRKHRLEYLTTDEANSFRIKDLRSDLEQTGVGYVRDASFKIVANDDGSYSVQTTKAGTRKDGESKFNSISKAVDSAVKLGETVLSMPAAEKVGDGSMSLDEMRTFRDNLQQRADSQRVADDRILSKISDLDKEIKKAEREERRTVEKKSEDAELDELFGQLKSMRGRLSMGVDPEVAVIGTKIAAVYMKKGVRNFRDFAAGCKENLGDDWDAFKKYLHSFWSGAMASNSDEDFFDEIEDISFKQAQSIIDNLKEKEGNTSREAQDDSTSNSVPKPDEGTPPSGTQRVADDRETGRGTEVNRQDLPQETDGGRGRGEDETASKPRAGRRDAEDGRNSDADRRADDSGSIRRDRNSVTAENYRYSDEDGKGGRSAIKQATANVDAIKTLKTILAEDRPATQAEQKILAQYSGWGSGEIANNIWPRKEKAVSKAWQDITAELTEILTDEEMQTAKRSTQYAHYTGPEIVSAIYKAVANMGITGGRALEPAIGTGNFIGAQPDGAAGAFKFTGVEMDGISANIAKLLYPQEDIRHSPFEKVQIPEGTFDLVIGNPPFGNIKVLSDKKYARQKFSLHDYFFAKSVDSLRPGGIMAMVVSRYTMDKIDSKAREFLAERAELVGAIRLPQIAFKKNAGTEVVTDVLFFKKREFMAPVDMSKETWTRTAEKNIEGESIQVNQYFHDNPEMIIGKETLQGSMRRANEYTVSFSGDIQKDLSAAISKLASGITEGRSATDNDAVADVVLAPDGTKESTWFEGEGGNLYISEDGEQIEAPRSQKRKIKLFIPIRDAYLNVLRLQKKFAPEAEVKSAQKDLRKAYDAFVKAFGPINKRTESSRMVTVVDDEGNTVIDEDTGKPKKEERISYRYPNTYGLTRDMFGAGVLALEVVDEDTGEVKRLADIFTEQVIAKREKPAVNNPADALVASMAERGTVDMDYIAEASGTTVDEAATQLAGKVFYDPVLKSYVGRGPYLSGNVKAKLAEAEKAAKNDPRMKENIDALKEVIPKDKKPSEITIVAGSPIVSADDAKAFIEDLGGQNVTVSYSKDSPTQKWNIRVPYFGAGAKGEKFGSKGFDAQTILRDLFNSKNTKIFYRDYDGKQVFDKKQSQLAETYKDQLRREFSAWINRNPVVLERIVQRYNTQFNTDVRGSFDGSYLPFDGLSPKINPHKHQRDVVARIIEQGNVYMAHEVGAGKTYASIMAGMEMKRLGLVKKPIYVVPNHMLEQFSREFLQAYPLAKIFSVQEETLSKDRRRAFSASVSLNNWDGIIITHSAFKKIGISEEAEARFIKEERQKLETALTEAKENDEGGRGRSPSVKAIEAQMEKLDNRMAKMSGEKDPLTIEDLGVDYMFVDEAHEYRKLSFATADASLKGVTPQGSDLAYNLYLKTKVLRERYPERQITFMSGTPITNTMGEMFSLMRFFIEDKLADMGVDSFDAWKSMFADSVTQLEANAAGNYKPVTRLMKFNNMSTLSAMWAQFGDYVSTDSLGLKRPSVKGGHRELSVSDASQAQIDYQTVLRDRLKAIEERSAPPKKGDDIILSVITDGRHAAIDHRFINPALPADPNSKIERAVREIMRIYREHDDKKAAQMVFSDLGVPSAMARRGFSVYSELRKRLIQEGIPEDEIAFMQDYKKHADKRKLFARVNSGTIRILIGSSKAMGTGVNAQERLAALHHIDAPWIPADMVQREGRIVRQGNNFYLQDWGGNVELIAYTTKGSMDETMWQLLETKQRMISQFLSGEMKTDTMDDLDSSANQFAMAKALTSNDPRIIRLADLQQQMERLNMLEAAHRDNAMQARYDEQRAVDSANYQKAFIQQHENSGQQAKKDIEADRVFLNNNPSTMEEVAKALEQLLENEFNGELSSKFFRVGSQSMHIERRPSGDWHISPFGKQKFNTGAVTSSATKKSGILSALKKIPEAMDQAIEAAQKYVKEFSSRAEAARRAQTLPFDQNDELLSVSKELEALREELMAEAANDDAAMVKKSTPGKPFGQVGNGYYDQQKVNTLLRELISEYTGKYEEILGSRGDSANNVLTQDLESSVIEMGDAVPKSWENIEAARADIIERMDRRVAEAREEFGDESADTKYRTASMASTVNSLGFYSPAARAIEGFRQGQPLYRPTGAAQQAGESPDLTAGLEFNDFTAEQQDEAMKMLTRIFGDKVNVQTVAEKLMTPDGQAALGKYRAGWITLVKGGDMADTALHESVHAAIDLFMTPEDKAALLADVNGDEEALAENFVRYAKDRSGFSAKVKRIAHRLLRVLRAIVGRGPVTPTDRITKFYDDLIDGYFSRKAGQESSGKTRYAVAGVGARTAGLPESAVQLERAGANRLTIWKETGWWRGPDGKWRFEVDDSQLEFKKSGSAADSLSEIIKHPDLFAAYPQLKGVQTLVEIDPDASQAGSYQPYEDRSPDLYPLYEQISVRAPDMDQAKETLMHEIQHAIQQIEGFGQGGNLDTNLAVAKQLSKQESDMVNREYLDAEKEMRKNNTAQTRRRFEAAKSEMDALRKKSPRDYKFKAYKLIPGEVESRTVQARLNMEPWKRKAEAPWHTMETMLREEGLLTDDQKPEDIFESQGGMRKAALTDRSMSIDGAESQPRFSIAPPVESEAFAKWFGDSKVVDADGNPLVVYHGTLFNFNAFDKDKIKSRHSLSLAFHFSDVAWDANQYAKDGVGNKENIPVGANVMPVYLKVENPLEIETDQPLASLEVDLNKPVIVRQLLAAKRAGNPYDGVIIRRKNAQEESEWNHINVIAFEPSQIKSATGNNGEYSSTNPDIRFRTEEQASKFKEATDGAVDWLKSMMAREFSVEEHDGKFYVVPSGGKYTDTGVEAFNSEQDAKDRAKLLSKGRNARPDLDWYDPMVRTISFYSSKVPALRRIYESVQRLRDNKHINGEEIFGEGEKDLGNINAFARKHRMEGKRLKDYIVQRDVDAIGYSVTELDTGMFEVRNPAGKVVATLDSDLSAWNDAFIREAEDYKRAGGSEEAAKALYTYRKINDREYRQLNRSAILMKAKMDALGLPMPKYEGYDIFEYLRQMGDIRGYRMPRKRLRGEFVLEATKEGENPIREHFALSITRKHRATQLRKQGYTVEYSVDKTPSEEAFLDANLVALNDIVANTMENLSADAAMVTLRDFDVSARTVDYERQDGKTEPHLLIIPANPTGLIGYATVLKGLGAVRFDDKQTGTGEQWRIINPPAGIEKALATAMFQHQHGVIKPSEAFAEMFTRQLAEIIHARGSRSSKIGRNAATGKDVWKGYEPDPFRALTMSGKSTAGGTAKRQMAQEIMKIITGTDIEWTDFKYQYMKDNNLSETSPAASQKAWAEYQKLIKERRIDSATQKRAYKEAVSYTREQLRNEEPMERVMGNIRGVAAFKHLSGIASGVVNLTALPITVIPSMNHFGNIPMRRAATLLGRGVKNYTKYFIHEKFGKGEAPTGEDVWLMRQITKRGFDDALMNDEAIRTLQNQAQQWWSKTIDLGMIVFQTTERINRGSTIAGAYYGLREQGMSKEDALVQAKEISDKGHGVYGKENLPAWMRGPGVGSQALRSFWMYKTFVHNYLQVLSLMIGGKNKKAVAHMLIAPAILSGPAASLATEPLVMFAKAIAEKLGLEPPDDPEEEFYRWIDSEFGGTAGRFARTGVVGGLAGVDLRGSLRVRWNEFIPTDLDSLLGAPYSLFVDAAKGTGSLVRGDTIKGLETLAPRFASGPLRAYREATEGVTSRNNQPLYYGNERLKSDFTSALLRSLSFNPASLSVKRDEQWSDQEAEFKYRDERTAIYAKMRRWALTSGSKADWTDILTEVERYNARVRKSGFENVPFITGSVIKSQFTRMNSPAAREKIRAGITEREDPGKIDFEPGEKKAASRRQSGRKPTKRRSIRS